MSHGKLEVITGCMFAGKTEELIRRLRRAKISGQSIEIVKPEIDDRYDQEKVSSHNGTQWEATVLPVSSSGEMKLQELDADVLAIDEFNFFEKEFLDILQSKADNGARVIICGLDQTYRGEPFSPMEKAMALADDVAKLSAICEECGEEATKTQRLVDGEPAPAQMPTIVVGGNENYQARCRDCHEVR